MQRHENPALERERIRRTLEDIYVHDMYVKGSREVLSPEFSEVFHMLVPELDGKTLQPTGLHWDGLAELKANHPKAMAPKTRFEFPLIDVTGNAAVARVDVFDGDRPVYSDYVSLYRVEGAWCLVSKVFHAHFDPVAAKPSPE